MIRSMTGYARAEAQGPWGRLAWELRSVNHRYLDLSLRLPEELRAIENEARQRLGARLSRGKVDAGLRHSREGALAAAVALDAETLRQLHGAIENVKRSGITLGAADPVRLLSWPGVVKAESIDNAPLLAAALELLDRAADDFTTTREREGARVTDYLLERCSAIEAHVAAVRSRLPQVRAQWVERLRARCRELGVEVDPARLEQEVVLAAQRLDVDEELSRLATHLTEVRQTLRRQDAVGRRLDFLMQELNREANTLSSKSQDAETTRLAVEIKVVIEQLREQVQNVE
ncbi:MAG: YicC/YloC family endoribonuclease [Gammaproteobacteria bacterium]